MAPPAWVVPPGLMGQGLPRRSHDPDLGRGAVACGPWQPMPGPVWTMGEGRRHRNGRPGALASSRMSGSSQPSSRRPGPRRVLTPDFRVALTFLGLGIFMNYVVRNSFAGFVASTLGIFLVVQTSRLRFQFSSDRVDVLRVGGLGETGEEAEEQGQQESSSSSSGSIGPWKYSSIRKWDFFWPGFPVVAYFKEDETRLEGRRHVFFVIADGKALYTEMMSRFGARKDLARVEEWDDLRPLSPKGYRRAVSRLTAAALQFERDMRMMERLRAIAASVNDRLARSRLPLVGKAVALLGSLAAAFGQALGKVTGSAPGRGTDP